MLELLVTSPFCGLMSAMFVSEEDQVTSFVMSVSAPASAVPVSNPRKAWYCSVLDRAMSRSAGTTRNCCGPRRTSDWAAHSAAISSAVTPSAANLPIGLTPFSFEQPKQLKMIAEEFSRYLPAPHKQGTKI